MVRTRPSQGWNRGSNPRRVTEIKLNSDILSRMKNSNEGIDKLKHWGELAVKIEALLQKHGGKPEHLNWTINMLRIGGNIETIKSDYFQQRDKLELYYKDIRDLLDEEFKQE